MTQEEFCHRVAEMLEAAGIPFMLAGSHAGSVHGRPRTTHDVDFVIDPTEAQLDHFLAHLGDDYYASRAAARDARRRRAPFNIIHNEAGWKADLIVRKDRPFSVEEFRRRRPEIIHGRPVPTVSPEDLILSKLEWDRISPSARQVADVTAVAVNKWATLDRDYLRRWAADLGVSEKLEEVLRHAERQQAGGGGP